MNLKRNAHSRIGTGIGSVNSEPGGTEAASVAGTEACRHPRFQIHLGRSRPWFWLTTFVAILILATRPLAQARPDSSEDSPDSPGSTSTFGIGTVPGYAGASNAIQPDWVLSFGPSEYAPKDIGSPAIAGSTLAVPGGYDVSGAGRDIGAGSDQFHLGYQQRTGDFDVQARVDGVRVTDPWLHAGLMARETLEAYSRFAAAFASSAQLGCFFESRATTASQTVSVAPAGGFPVNYPQTWLRLRRLGNSLTGFASQDGQVWGQLGTVSLSGLPATIYFGLAVCSEDATQASTVRFREVGPTQSPAIGSYTSDHEPLGPSNRSTGIIISEMMYHPPARADGKNLEFVELYNARSVFEDLSGWSISGDIEFKFPVGCKLQAGEFVVIAAAPGNLRDVYGITNVLGPYLHSLPNDAGTLRLRNNLDAIRLAVNYSGNPPWPVAADGAGHSLVLARPSWGENNPRAWAASERMGGSPGGVEAIYPNPQRNVMINEILAHTDDPQLDFFELYNHSNSAVDLSGCWLSDERATLKFRIPSGSSIGARGFLSWDQNQLGFNLDAAGETLFLVSSNQTRVLDAAKFGGQENGVALGRSPDGAPALRRLANPTPGAANAPRRSEDIVLNEIMYNPISGDRADEYVELYNRGAQAVDLSGWRFTEGIDFKFPANLTLAANSYFVVAKNAAQLIANYPQLSVANTIGNFAGTLRNSGESLVLARPEPIISTNTVGEWVTNTTYVVIAEAAFSQGGRWGQWADGGGSSLELIDPNADPLRASNWADSDETQKAAWTPAEFSGRLDNGNSDSTYSPIRLFVLLEGAGECLVDDVEVLKAGSTNLLSNGGFENGISGWSFFGNHSQSTVDSTGAARGTRCLHVRAQGDGDTGANSIRASLAKGLAAQNTATLRAKVRWLAGWPEVLFRVRGNWIEMPVRMALPPALGTPGLPNSRRTANAGPALFDVVHAPALPAANQSVIVITRATDPDGIGSLRLLFRIDPSTSLTSVAMRDDGAGGDAVAGDGIYSATISGRGAGTLAAFRIEAADGASTPATTRFPASAPAQECLIRWGDPVPWGNFAHYHLWSTRATENARRKGLDNTYRDTTLVYRNFRIVYNAGFRDKGSPWHGGIGDFAVTVPPDDLLLGATDRVFGSTGNGDSEPTGIRSQLAAWLAQQLGIPYLNAQYVRLYRNGAQFRNVMEDIEQPNHDYASRWFPEDSEGSLYKIYIWYEFQDDNSTFSPVFATLERFLTTGNAFKQARYRWNWRPRPNERTANNYTNIYELVSAANDGTSNHVSRLLNLANLDQWMRVFTFERIMGNWDSWSYNIGQNMFVYKPPHSRWVLMPWDIDIILGIGDGPTAALWGGHDPVANRIYNVPAFRRMLWRGYIDAVNGPMLAERFSPQIQARRTALLRNGISGTSDPQVVSSYLTQRRSYIQGQIRANDVTTFAITNNGGNNFKSATPTSVLGGTAPFAVATIEVNDIPYPVNWTDPTHFQIAVPLTQPTNRLALVGKDRLGKPVASAADTITVSYAGAIQQPQDYVVFNEIHYNPDAPRASYIELFNRSTTTPFDLSHFRLEGVGYTFAEGAIIAPNAFLLLAKDHAAFATAYSATIPVFDQFPGTLSNGGEHLALVKPGATPAEEVVISDVRYDSRLPWPANADGLGPSLQLIDAAQDEYRVGNWAATATNNLNRTTPGRANSVRQSLLPFPLVWINEVLPNNLSSVSDNAGQRDPWIELYNSGDTAVDLSLVYLTDSYTNLTQWQFPPGASIGSKQFLLVWADGQPDQSITGALHTNFRLSPTNGAVALVRLQGSPLTPAVMDYLDYALPAPDRSFGSYPDGEPRQRRLFYNATAGATNNPAFPPTAVVINELMAGNSRTVLDPATGRYEDWFELYNAGTNVADLTSYSLTDNLTNANQFVIPPGYPIPPGGFLLVWADNETEQNNATNADLHVNFKLAAATEQLGLFAPDGRLVDGFDFGQQTNDVSLGRYPDGAHPPLVFMETPSPGTPNVLAGGNQPPVLSPMGSQTVPEQSLLTLIAAATDSDPTQTLTFSLGTDAPDGAAMDSATGQLTWTPTEAQGPGTYRFTIRVADNGSPPRSAIERITVNVTEVNRAPALSPIADATVDEGALFSLTLTATDPDLPSNALTFALDSGAPDGVTIDSGTGLLTWIPSEAQGSAQYAITVRVTDNSSPPLSDAKTFNVTVNEANNLPVLDSILPQTVDELSLFTLTVHAIDPDTPPSAILYSLAAAPEGARIDPTTGLITWTPAEAQGPTNAIFIVRATESAPSNLSATATFSVTVNEKNQAPALAPIPDFNLSEGETASFTASALDADLPAQKLKFGLEPGAPAGASIDPVSGRFTWAIHPDQGAGTNRITVRVADDGPGNLSDTKTFIVVVRQRWHVVINEIMHHPAATNAEYIELFNTSSNTTQDLSSLRLTATNLDFAFPLSTGLSPRSFLCVAKNLAAFSSAYGSGRPVVGPWNGALGSVNTLKLIRPEAGGQSYQLLDLVSFASTAPWPVAAGGGGASLQLMDAIRDNDRVGNWSATAAYTGPRQLITMTNQWRYYQGGPLDSAAWRDANYTNDAAWPLGRALLYVEGAALPAPKNTELTLGDLTYYFRTRFTLPSVPTGASLTLSCVLDDGMVVWLNGHVLYRLGVDVEDPDYDTLSSRTVTDAVLEGPFTLPADFLVPGENVVAVEVHQLSSGSSDIVFGMSLELVGGSVAAFTPGAPNNVVIDVPEFPSVRINEVLARNTAGLVDAMGERDPWIELINTGINPASLDGLFLTDDYANLTKWTLPSGRHIPGAGFQVIFADGESGETTATELHANLRLPTTAGAPFSLALARLQNGQPAIVDYFNGQVGPDNQSVGRQPDGDPSATFLLANPTPGNANSVLPPLHLEAVGRTVEGFVQFAWVTVPGRTYRVECTADLQDAAWRPLAEFVATSALVSFIDLTMSGAIQRFYRVRRVP